MGIQDRDWYREEQERKRKLYGDGGPGPKRRRRWPYRLRPDLPWWVREIVRQSLFWGVIVVLYLAWINRH